MTVSAILREKAGDVFTVTAGDTIAEVAATLAAKRIGAVLVKADDGKPYAGIVSERDIVRGIAGEGAGVLDKPVTHLMTRSVKACAPGDTIATVMAAMTDGRFRHMPVIEKGELIGFISIGDVVRRRIGEVEHEADAIREYVNAGAA